MNISKHAACPCHGCRTGTSSPVHQLRAANQFRKFATPVELAPEREYAFEEAASNIRFGQGVTREVGMDFANMKAKRVRSGVVSSSVTERVAHRRLTTTMTLCE